MDKADHSGHRDRLRAKYLNNGADSLEPHEILEMLLFYAVPYRNTNDIAKRLLDDFGSLSAVFDASIEMLTDSGLTQNQAVFIKLIPDVTRLYSLDKHNSRRKILSRENIASYLIDKFIGFEEKETILLVLLDAKSKELYCGPVSEGDFKTANISLRKIIHLALNYNASGAILAHNHPSGFAMPSSEDYYATKQIKAALGSVGVELLDHIIVADNDAVSMASSGMLD